MTEVSSWGLLLLLFLLLIWVTILTKLQRIEQLTKHLSPSNKKADAPDNNSGDL